MHPTRSTRAATLEVTPRRIPRRWVAAVLITAVSATLYSCGSGYGGGGSNPTGPGTTRELNSGNIAPGGTFGHRFATAGTYHYHCTYHGPMKGTVTVSDAAVDTLVTVSIVSSTSPFPGASVKTGGRVVWNNGTSMAHTVTSD